MVLGSSGVGGERGFMVIMISSSLFTIPSSFVTVDWKVTSVCSFTTGAVKVGFEIVESLEEIFRSEI